MKHQKVKEFHPTLLPRIRELSIKAHREVLSRTLSGNWLSMIKGRGIEFSGYRQYLPSDDASMIDWRASLRARKLLVKELTEEKNLNVLIMVDVSNSMLYGSKDILKAEYVAELVSSIAFAALRAGDAVGLVTFTDTVEQFINPNIGVSQHQHMCDTLSKPSTYGGPCNLKKAMTEVMSFMKQRSLIIVVSDFIALGEGWDEYLRVTGKKHDLIGLVVRDPRDRRLPKRAGEYTLEDPFNDEKLVIDCANYYKPYREYVQKEEDRINNIFHSVKSEMLVLETDEDYVKNLMTFFRRRERMVMER